MVEKERGRRYLTSILEEVEELVVADKLGVLVSAAVPTPGLAGISLLDHFVQ